MTEHIVCLSGGKDSTTMLLKMIDEDVHIDRILFADTTFEYPEMYVWLDMIERLVEIPITRLHSKKSFDDWFYGAFTKGKLKGRRRGFPYAILPCWWCRESKIYPLQRAQGKANIIYVGIAYDERHRAARKQYNNTDNTYKFPLVEWEYTESMCASYLDEWPLEYPLRKFDRTGCWLCPKQSLKSLRILYEDYSELWEKLKRYESDSPHGFRPDYSLDELEERFAS